MNMALQQPVRWRPLIPFLYPPRRTWPVRSLHLQPSGQKNAAQKSMAVHRQEASNKENIRGDLGLLPGTFVRPTGPKKPSLLRDPRKWMALEWYWAKRKWESITGLFFYKFFLRKGKPRPKLDRRKVGPKAQVMYENMYTSFANGDIESLKSICLEGVVASLRSRINSRRPDEKVRWTLHKYIGRPRIVSTKIAALPDLDTSALYQVVVQIKSVQSLKGISKGRNAEKDTVAEDSKGKQNGVVEYLVMQKMMLRGREGSWKIWGTMEETDVKDVWKEQSSKPKARSPAVAK